MADVADVVPAAIDTEGNLVIWWTTAAIADLTAPGKAAVFDAATTFRVTHSFTPGGFALGGSQAKNADERLALPDVLETLGKVSRTLSLEYVDSAAAGSAAVVLKPVAPAVSKSGHFIVRSNLPNGTIAAAAQTGWIYPTTVGAQVRPIAGTGKFLVTQEAVITGTPVAYTAAA